MKWRKNMTKNKEKKKNVFKTTTNSTFHFRRVIKSVQLLGTCKTTASRQLEKSSWGQQKVTISVIFLQRIEETCLRSQSKVSCCFTKQNIRFVCSFQFGDFSLDAYMFEKCGENGTELKFSWWCPLLFRSDIWDGDSVWRRQQVLPGQHWAVCQTGKSPLSKWELFGYRQSHTGTGKRMISQNRKMLAINVEAVVRTEI